MNGQKATISRRRGHAVRFLVCDITGQFELTSSEGEWAMSLIQFLDKAVDLKPGITVVRFGEMEISERKTPVELCAALKRNRHTRERPVLALLPAKHRRIMEELAGASVDFIKFVGEETLSAPLIIELIDGLGPDDRIEHQLQVVCGYLHYDTIDARHEITVCGAYLDRMVLGGTYLREICHTEKHLQCEYFLNPRVRT
jgi:hypothetical protein